MAFVIPTIFTAVDKFTAPMKGMATSAATFGERMNILAARSERAFNRMPNIISKATSSLIAYGEAAAGIGAALFVGKSILDYQTEIQDLSAVTGATGQALEIFKSKIQEVAQVTRTSMTDVAKAFTAVDNNMPELHGSASGLGEVTKQAIILAQASRMELAPAAEALTMTLNQFNLKAKDSQGVIDALAGGAVAGSSRISQTSEALMKFGAAAEGIIGITYNEAIALVELGSKFEKGSEAGTRLRNILIDMGNVKLSSVAGQIQAMGVNLDKVSDKKLPFAERLKELSKIKNNPELMEGLFGKRNEVMASGLFRRVDDYARILDATYGQGGAQEMANKENDTFIVSMKRLRDAFINQTIESTKTHGVMAALNSTTQFLTEHIDGLTSIAGMALVVFGGWWALTKLFKAIAATTWLVNAAFGVFKALEGATTAQMQIMTFQMGLSEGAMVGYTAAAKAMSLGIAGILGPLSLVASALYLFSSVANSTYGTSTELNDSLTKTKDGFVQIAGPIDEAKLALEAYNAAATKYNEKKLAIARLNYHDKYNKAHNREDTWGDFIKQIPDAIKAGDGVLGEAPKAEDYPGIDTTQIAKPASTDEKKVTVVIENSTNMKTRVKDEGNAMGVTVVQSRNYRGGTA
jgi:TP901 family phage tail tape measure protein